MASLPNMTVIELSHVSPPPATVVGNKLLPLSFFDFLWLRQHPIHYLFFYELSITETQFVETFVPRLKHSLSTTLQHFYPFAGNLFAFPTPKTPEIRYVEGDSVKVTFAKTNNQDFTELTANHPRNCDKFYHLIPLLGEVTKTSNYIKVPLFSVQVTLFPHHGISIGMTNHHTLGDASTRFLFLKAWTSIARFGTDETFLANGTLPVYDRMVKNPKQEESYGRFAKVESLYQDYAIQSLSGPSDKLRATFILTRTTIDQLKKTISTQLPTLSYVSSYTVTCAYIWSCIAKIRNDELQVFGCPADCRTRMDPPIPAAYFGNCLGGCVVMEKRTSLTGKEGFLNAAKLLGESLHKALTETGGVFTDIEKYSDLLSLPTLTGVAGTPKLKVYDMNFGWGNPKKVETISIDYTLSISMNACSSSNESNQDLEIGISLSATEMEDFVRIFHDGLKTYII